MAVKKKAKRNTPDISEKAAWRDVLQLADSVRKASAEKTTRAKAQQIMEVAADMLDQLARGLHRNSPLTVLSLVNPPRGGKLMSDHLYTLEYQHKANGKDYYHDFRKGTQLHAMPDGSLRISRPGAKMWGDFPAE